MDRNEIILSLRGVKSYNLIAAQLGISRNAVAGVMWREKWSKDLRKKIDKRHNRSGTGRHGPGKYADLTIRNDH